MELSKLVATTVPANRTRAVVLDVDGRGVAVTVKMVKGRHWEVDSVLRHDFKGATDGQARVIYSW